MGTDYSKIIGTLLPSSSTASLHAIKLDYNHLEYQRTQIYGNLIYKQETNSQALSEINVL